MADPPAPPAAAGLHNVVPALPVRDVAASVARYTSAFGFTAAHVTDDFAVVVRDAAVVNLWAAADEGWRGRADLAVRPVRSGAESFLAGTASCRIQVADLAALHALRAELAPHGVLHPAHPAVVATDFGTQELSALDPDGNLLTFVFWPPA